ncbi:MAG: DUF2726 domain-containing protein [Dehalococcoidia bacterium]|nr:DUF2726 domain-containing protein [Dehalococcoidia bacterium]
MGFVLVLFVFLAVAGVVVIYFRSRDETEAGRTRPSDNASRRLPYSSRQYLLSRAERSLYGVLEQAVQGEYRIFAKVRLADLVYVERGAEKWQAHFNRIAGKHADFVICSLDSVSPLLVVELDDRSHERADRVNRDGFVNDALASAKLPILHVRARSSYDVSEVADAIRRAMASDGNAQHMVGAYR